VAFDRGDTGVPDFNALVCALSSFVESEMRLRHKPLPENVAYGLSEISRGQSATSNAISGCALWGTGCATINNDFRRLHAT
jgi:hypothetical protein